MIQALFNRLSARRWLNNLTLNRPENYSEAMQALDEAKTIIREQNEKIIRLIYEANSDELTGLLNPRGLSQLMEYEADRLDAPAPEASKTSGVIIALDMAFLKSINDTLGHDAGDKAIKTFSKILKRNVRRTDFAARNGGDEFVVVLRDTNLLDAASHIKKIHEAIEKIPFEYEGHSLHLSARMGVAEYNTQNNIHNALLEADKRQIEARKKEPEHKQRGAKLSLKTSTPAPLH